MPENDHACEYDNAHDDYADGKPLPALLKVAFVLCEIKFFVLKLIHLDVYYITYSCWSRARYRRSRNSLFFSVEFCPPHG